MIHSPGMPRRRLLGAAAGGFALAARRARAAEEGGAEDQAEWRAFRDRFVSADGRVVDTGNQGVSHTEGQGWGLLFAVYFDDRACFSRLRGWTERTLRRRDDSLHAWRYVPGAARPVADQNNATDGDLFIAWALVRAARRWGVTEYRQTAATMAHDILRLLVRQVGGRSLLLPGLSGFEDARSVTVNPSYYAFPALSALAPLAPSPVWAALQQDGLALIDQGRFGRWQLPPDWLRVDRQGGALSPDPRWPARCSFDAIRVPLYIGWAGLAAPSVDAAYAAFYVSRGGAPAAAWVDLNTGAEAPYPASPGMLAVAGIAAAGAGLGGTAIDFPHVAAAQDYYAAALILLARIAWRERPGA